MTIVLGKQLMHWLIDQNTANAAHAAANAADAANVIYYANNAGKSLNWLYSLYQYIYKPHSFPNHYKTINIAKAILKDNDFKSMPILADTELLLHLRYNKDLWTPVDWFLSNLVK